MNFVKYSSLKYSKLNMELWNYSKSIDEGSYAVGKKTLPK